MTKRHIVLALVVAVGTSLLLAAHAYSSSSTEVRREAHAPLVATIAPEATSGYVHKRSFTGEVKARRRSVLGFELAGRVILVAVDDGDAVTKGQILARLDVEALAADRRRVAAERSGAGARLDEMRAGPRKQIIAAARHAVADLEARTDLLRRKQQRRRLLLADKHISTEEFDEVAASLTSTEALWEMARDRLAELEAGTRIEKLRAQEARLAALDAQLQRLDVDLAKGTLSAPFSGHVETRHVDEGTVLAPGSAVFTLVEDGRLEAWIGVAPKIAARMQKGETYRVRVGEKTYDAQLRGALPAADPVTRSRTVILDLPPIETGHAVPGQMAVLEIEERVPTEGLWVPVDALAQGVRGLWALYAVERVGGRPKVARHHVEVLHVQGERALVRGTLTPKDHVLIGDTSRVVPGQFIVPQVQRNHP